MPEAVENKGWEVKARDRKNTVMPETARQI